MQSSRVGRIMICQRINISQPWLKVLTVRDLPRQNASFAAPEVSAGHCTALTCRERESLHHRKAQRQEMHGISGLLPANGVMQHSEC